MPTFLQHAALVRGLRISTPTYPKFGPIVLSSFVACESVHDCSRAWIALYTLGARINIVKVSLGVPHSRAVLAILLQHALGPDGDQYEVLQRAEACTVARAQDCYCIPQQVEHLSPTHLQNAALARGLSAFVTTRLRPRQLRLPSYAAREDMHDCSHAQIVLHLLRVEASTFSQFLSMPHATARLATRPRSGPRPHNRVYKISQRAEACTTARTPIIFPIPFPARQHVPTFPQSAASARAFSNFASPLPQPRKPLLRSYAARRDVHGRLWPLPAPQYLMEKNSSFRLLRALHAAADLATRHQRGPRLDRRLYRISGCAEACLTASVQVWSLIPLSPEQLIASFPQSATRVRTVSDSVSQYSRPGKSRLQNYAARGAVLDHSYPRLSPLLLRVETSSVQASQRMPQSSAALVTRCRRAQDPNERPYQVARRAEVCTVTRALSWPLLPLSSEKFTQTFPQITALVCGPSNSVSTLLRLEYPPQ
ncbi:hypothetical protein BJV77DRAFT_369146 [Russula vinacea]|nr:hypothetical protein BJV77DRAFT_369146 [Russula vinacea]